MQQREPEDIDGRLGYRLGTLGLPTVYCMEGGYAVAEIGLNTVNVLSGHVKAQS